MSLPTNNGGRGGKSNALTERLNNQIKEREAERREKIQRERAEELKALRGRNHENSETLSPSKKNTTENKNKLDDISKIITGKSNMVATMKSAMNLEDKSKAAGPVIMDLNDFYRKQRLESEKDKGKKHEAADNLHGINRNGKNTNTTPHEAEAVEAKDQNKSETKASVVDVPVEVSSTSFDFGGKDYRGFIFLLHEDFGLMLLYCTRKRKKGPHFQLPGGHVDEAEFISATRQNFSNPKEHLLFAGKKGAARELFEETGLDFRNKLDRLEPAHLSTKPMKNSLLTNEYHHRIFFVIHVDDHDFRLLKNGEAPPVGMSSPLSGQASYLLLKLSDEHSGFTFEKDMANAATLLKQHSGGKCMEALKMYESFRESGETPEALDAPSEWFDSQQSKGTMNNVVSSTSTSAKSPPSESALSPTTPSKWEEISNGKGSKAAPKIPTTSTISTSHNTIRPLVQKPTTKSSNSAKQHGKYQEQYMKAISPSQDSSYAVDRTGIELLNEETEESDDEVVYCFCCKSRKKKSAQRGEEQSLLH